MYRIVHSSHTQKGPPYLLKFSFLKCKENIILDICEIIIVTKIIKSISHKKILLIKKL